MVEYSSSHCLSIKPIFFYFPTFISVLKSVIFLNTIQHIIAATLALLKSLLLFGEGG